MKSPHTIDEVIEILDKILDESIENNDPLGYFAALYQKVTIKVKEGIENDFFDDGSRMEQLDIAFAQRYFDAYFAHQKNEPVTISWKRAFRLAKNPLMIVLQHLLVGINAHINLDLGIAAAHISEGKNIEDLENDFNKINEILIALVYEVQDELSQIWPGLKFILSKTGKADDFFINFNMELARKGAWKFAKKIAGESNLELDSQIKTRDKKVGIKANLISFPGVVPLLLQLIIRVGERGSVSEKIRKLRAQSSLG